MTRVGRGDRMDSRKDSSLAHLQEPVIARVILKRGREGPVRGGNPWIFSQAIERIGPASVEAGGLVSVHDASGPVMGLGYCNPPTAIAIRMIACGETPASHELCPRRVEKPLALRSR